VREADACSVKSGGCQGVLKGFGACGVWRAGLSVTDPVIMHSHHVGGQVGERAGAGAGLGPGHGNAQPHGHGGHGHPHILPTLESQASFTRSDSGDSDGGGNFIEDEAHEQPVKGGDSRDGGPAKSHFMANFYYRRSKSSNALTKGTSPGGQQGQAEAPGDQRAA
jgi:hypothetical protein